jgi:CO/xanthine dehydrogenase Mo-binding subunit
MPVPNGHVRTPPSLVTEARYVGEAVAVVVATDPYRAADAADAVEVEYAPLPVVEDPERALDDGAPLVYSDVPGNVAVRVHRSSGESAPAFDAADVILRERFTTARAAGAAIEPRAVAAQPGDGSFAVTLWDATQAPHGVRRGVAAALGLPEERVRVVVPDVGGGFGPKGRLYPEEVVLAALALRLGRPVLWQATRQEDLTTTYQGRGIVIDAELAARADGTILGLRARLLQDCGAYLATGAVVPLASAQHLLGPYRIPAYVAEITVVYTHKAPLTPLRGGGREQGIFAIERLLDHLARRLQRDPVELRLQNILRPADFPYDTGYPSSYGAGTVVYDSGDYPAYLEQARELIAYDAVRQAQPHERPAGRYRGVAVTAFLEATGLAAESARVAVAADGTVQVTVGSPSTGQGHATSLAQVCAARLGVPAERVAVTSGDTGAMEQGTGTFASRMAVMAGNAVAQAAAAVRQQALAAAAELLEVSADDLDLADGTVAVRGVPGPLTCAARRPEEPVGGRVELAELAHHLQERGEEQRLRATRTFAPPRPVCFAGGAHAAVVVVDVETGRVEVERYAVVHDCGTVLNPLIVEGQIHGGVAHGLGNALWEAMVYDEAGQLLTGDLPDYALPHAEWVPPIAIAHHEQPSPYNPEGIKGAGEGGTIGSLATIAGAVEDALAPLNLTLNSLPLRSEDLARACSPLRTGGWPMR